MQIQFSKLLIPYLVAKQVEKILLNRLDSDTKMLLNKKLKRFPEVDNLSEKTQNGLGTRGGTDPFTLWFTKLFVLDFAIKVTLGSGICASIGGSTADTAAFNIVKFGTAILQAPGNKFRNFSQKLRGIDYQQNQDIREILLDKNLSVKDRLELVRIKVEQTIKTLKGAKRTKFILFVMATLIFFFGGNLTGNVAVFTAVMERLRALLGMDGEEDLRGALIDVYREYNAPLPEELAKAIENISSY